MHCLRTPDERFENLPGYSFAPHYTEVDDGEGGRLRIHHIDEGPREAPIVLCMHGQPSWSYLYRHMISALTEAGLRVIAPDLVGYGRSDKPAAREDYSYQRQVDWMTAWLVANDLHEITFFGQDWGGLIGLRLVAENQARFARVVIANTGLPTPADTPAEVAAEVRRFRAEAPTPTMAEVMAALSGQSGGSQPLNFAHWQKWCWETEDLPVGLAVAGATGGKQLSAEEIAAYDAPFPDASYKMGARAMPTHVPTLADDPSVAANLRAWEVLRKWEKPFVCAFSDNDPVSGGGEKRFIAKVPGAQNRTHITINGGGHFLQEAKGEELAAIVAKLIREPS
ncbi:MAG: haloalkane dehalogenase [Deltaproteobacteria bacterium]